MILRWRKHLEMLKHHADAARSDGRSVLDVDLDAVE